MCLLVQHLAWKNGTPWCYYIAVLPWYSSWHWHSTNPRGSSWSGRGSYCRWCWWLQYKVEVKATKEAAQEAYQHWLSTTDEGWSAGVQDRANTKLNELMHTQVGYHGDNKLKIGLMVGMDGGVWQKRSIGTRGTYNSKTGHNFAIGGYTKKIISVVASSKHCFRCDRATKLGIDAPIHRWLCQELWCWSKFESNGASSCSRGSL